ncbi:CHAT domain-containing protein [Nostoc sphaeroides CHAB 2801]|uniref:CHAT domain-containing protein n=1 Tax=Nostoc sphaeroides TaxID=446679 RepID=UPI001E3F5484|nr:CHAT domain-containing protein [Nostoc sphaeroides]MCC5631978.1 CHAT domain-containing protein [Nostoc sphaeroides CHAB 2801]
MLLERSARESDVNFRSLPFTCQEAEGIFLEPKSSIKALRFDANRAFAMNPQLSQYRYIHFATHGILNSTNPQLSGVVLSLVNQKGETENGFLRLNDIFNLKLPAELVVLSACETALGKEVRGEGLVGLTRGFMYAGSPRLVVSLWKVQDEGTSVLMKKFYTKMLLQGLKPAEALRTAQLEMSQDKKYFAPYYWAGFTLQGEWK